MFQGLECGLDLAQFELVGDQGLVLEGAVVDVHHRAAEIFRLAFGHRRVSNQNL